MTAKTSGNKRKIRNSEYYDMVNIQDKLYERSLKKHTFNKLMDLITSPNNIKLAYRNIKRNPGSKTKGTNNTTVLDIEKLDDESVVKLVQDRFKNYHPHEVRRVYIPKPNGDKRPLGIPSFEDRLVQQCILQILEPICEARFYNHSYGFRPNRSTHHAVSRMYYLININQLNYAVDIDIKGFFDNISHSKLKKQMWNLGIRDKTLLAIIDKILKAPIKGEGIPQKGTPQGGVISPLLSNIVLNELDWWVASQWEHFPTKHQYHVTSKSRAIRKTNLKEVYLVRYADDFKILCRDYESAVRMFNAVKKWLEERLGLKINEEKSKVINLKKNYSEFLGFKIKSRLKKNRYAVSSYLSDKSRNRIIETYKKKIKDIKLNTTVANVTNLNTYVLGIHNYYRIATNVNLSFDKVRYRTLKNEYNQLKNIYRSHGQFTRTFYKFFKGYTGKIKFVAKVPIFPIGYIQTWTPTNFTQTKCNYTPLGRELLSKELNKSIMKELHYLLKYPIQNRSIEYNDNRISRFSMQNGLCYITKQPLLRDKRDCHHVKPISLGGDDKFNNLIWITTDVHNLIHSTNTETINKYLEIIKPTKEILTKINSYRKKAGNHEI